MIEDIDDGVIQFLKENLPKNKSIVFVGMMGAGKSTVGRKVAFKLDLDFIDTDLEIENAAQLSILEIFSNYGEAHFREIERKIIIRLLNQATGIISVGGGAFMDDSLREAIKKQGISVWLRADLETLLARVHKQEHRPLLTQDDPEKVMRRLIDTRYPIYEQSDITVKNNDISPDKTVDLVLEALIKYLKEKK